MLLIDSLQFAKSNEFGEAKIRLGERGTLNALNKGGKVRRKNVPDTSHEKIRFSLGVSRVSEIWEKHFILTQAALEKVEVDNFDLKQDMAGLLKEGPRVCRALTGEFLFGCSTT